MSSTSGPNIATSGLVLDIDMSNTQKSWNGKPTVNYITSPTNEVIATASEFAVFQDLSPIFHTYGTGSYSITADIKTPKPGSITVYTASGGVEYDIGYFSASCDTYYKTFYFNNISVTQTNPAQTVSNLSFYGGYGSGLFPSIKNVQVEKSTYCTPFVVGTRSNTQALLDLTGNNTLTATSLTYASNNTFSFNGSSDTISIPNTASLQVADTFTVSAWINATSLSTRKGIFSTRTANTTGCWQLEVGTGSGGTGRVVVTGISTYIWESSDNVVTTNTWYNICFVKPGNGVQGGSMYLNGTLLTPATTTAYTILNNSDAKVIGQGTSGTQFFPGNISNVQLYNRALTASEVAQNFNAIRSRYGL